MSHRLFGAVAGALFLLGMVRPVQAAEKWAVIVGVDDYGENIPHLRYAVADAKRFYSVVSKCTPADHVVLLATDGAGLPPTGANIVQSVARLARRAKPDDEFWFCFSGHGEDQNGVHYLLPSDASVSDYKATAVDLKALRDSLTLTCAARHKILVVDACHSGWDDLAEGRRGAGTGVATVWASCSARESSWEIPALGEGVFTWFFLKKQGEIAPNRLTLPSQDDAKTINTHVETYILRNKKPFTQTPQVIGTLPGGGLIPVDGAAAVSDPPGVPAARIPLGPALLLDLSEERTQLSGKVIKSNLTQSLLRAALVQRNFPLVDPAAASRLKTLLNRESAGAAAKKLGARYLIRGHAESEATKMAITGNFVTVQATVTAELINEQGNVLAQTVVGSTQDEPVAGTDITEIGAAKMAFEEAVQKLTAILLPKLRSALTQSAPDAQ